MNLLQSRINLKPIEDKVLVGFDYIVSKSKIVPDDINIDCFFSKYSNARCFLLDNGNDFIFVDESMFAEAMRRYGDCFILGVENENDSLPTIFIGDKQIHKELRDIDF